MALYRISLTLAGIIVLALNPGCKEESLKINYKLGFFPDTVMAIEGINTQYDDYNSDLEASIISSGTPLVFSSNRQSSGGEFDLTYAALSYTFGQTTGHFEFGGDFISDPFLDNLTSAFRTSGDEFGPYGFFNSGDGHDYMTAATEKGGSGLDLVFTRYLPIYTGNTAIPAPVPATVFNTVFNDAYLTFSSTLDTAYFCSDRSGNFDIYLMRRPPDKDVDEWFASVPAAAFAVDSLISDSNEKCPFVNGKYMIFASDMPGGSGGYDLYISVFRGGKWSTPVNLGPDINSSANEYRPVIGTNQAYSNSFLIFSSDRSGGKGGFDLYFAGINLPD